jgi:ADP-ribosylglycohydrolase
MRVLDSCGCIDQDALARMFAGEYQCEPNRGYGGTAHRILTRIHLGTPWQTAASEAFSGMGSMGNGGAMRAAPLGAYFADDIGQLIDQARKSAEVTHAHAEGQAGAIAVALASAYTWNHRGSATFAKGLFEFVLAHLPAGETRTGVEKASGLALDLSIETAADFLGNGSRVISQDTVPLCLWCVARHFDNYETALWTTVAALGDRDTNCAIVGGIVALSAAAATMPSEWMACVEKYPALIALIG